MPAAHSPAVPHPSSIPLARVLAEALAAHAQQAFGLMGNGNAHLIDALGAAGVALTTVRHEAGAVAAADAYTRVSGRLAIATTTYGAGFTNALTALTEAAQARTPMLVVVGDAPTSGPRPWDVDQEMLAAAIGVRTHVITGSDPRGTVDRAAAAALRGRKPVVLAIPYDLAASELAMPPQGTAPTTSAPDAEGIDLDDPELLRTLIDAVRPAPSVAASPASELLATRVSEAAKLLSRAERPLVIAGRGAHLAGAAPELGALADCLGALTATTALARGIFSGETVTGGGERATRDRSAFDLGVIGGFGQEAAMAVIVEADVVVVIGAGLNQFTMRFGELLGPGTAVVRIDLDEVAAPRSVCTIEHHLLRGDARDVLRELLVELEGFPAQTPPVTPWRERLAGLEPGGALRRIDTGAGAHPQGRCADGRLDPRAVAARLAELLPADRHVTTDGGHFLGWCNMFWPVAEPPRMIMPGTAYQTIGLGLSTVAGVAAAAPESTVVLSTGDGGGLMALADLETAIRTAARCVIVVWNDGCYAAEVHLYGAMGLDERVMRIPEVDFAALATALGATGVRVTELADLDALARWSEAGGLGTILLDCRISRSVIAPYFLELRRANGVADPG